MNFKRKLEKICKKNNSLLCIGLDYPLFKFNKTIIDATYDLVCAYKPNSAFYEAKGEYGLQQLGMTLDYIHNKYPEIVTIFDAKRGDIANTNKEYVKYIFDYLGVDGVTLHPYLGKEALLPFLRRKNKGCIILCRTSNTGAREIQNLKFGEKPLYQIIAEKVIKKWNTNNNCLLVIGATYPKELAAIRKMTDEMTFLVPGIGLQGGDVKKTVKAGINSKRSGMIINSSRSIIYADNPRNEAEKIRDEINRYRI